MSSCPADLPAEVLGEAEHLAATVLSELGVVGVACVEFFLTKDDRVLVNEIAPRTHNSGHLTIEACPTSQFEQQVRDLWTTAWCHNTTRSGGNGKSSGRLLAIR